MYLFIILLAKSTVHVNFDPRVDKINLVLYHAYVGQHVQQNNFGNIPYTFNSKDMTWQH